jgi:hypothetical protein
MEPRVDFGIAERVLGNIRENNDSEFSELRWHVEDEIVNLAAAVSRFRNESPAGEGEVSRARFELSLAVSRFVSRAFAYYANIRHKRAFSPKEMSAGKELPLLLGQGMALIEHREQSAAVE